MIEQEEVGDVEQPQEDTRGSVRLEAPWMQRLRVVATRRHRTAAAQIRAMVELEEAVLGIVSPGGGGLPTR
jgi:hypothetical protein